MIKIAVVLCFTRWALRATSVWAGLLKRQMASHPIPPVATKRIIALFLFEEIRHPSGMIDIKMA